MDLVVRVARIPAPGETVPGSDLLAIPGGRGGVGASLAVATARLGCNTHLVARVGADDLGSRLLASLESHAVSTTFVTVTESAASGTTLVLDENSSPAAIISPGANALLSPDDIDRALPLIRTAGAVLLHLGIPLPTALHTLRVCHRARVPVILDPSPLPTGTQLPPELLGVSILTPNLTQAATLLASPPNLDPQHLATELLAKGPSIVILKLGDLGALHATTNPNSPPTFLQVPAFKVKVKDPSGAGTAFSAAIAVARAESMPPHQSLRFANATAALACTQPGLQSALPSRADVNDLVNRWG